MSVYSLFDSNQAAEIFVRLKFLTVVFANTSGIVAAVKKKQRNVCFNLGSLKVEFHVLYLTFAPKPFGIAGHSLQLKHKSKRLVSLRLAASILELKTKTCPSTYSAGSPAFVSKSNSSSVISMMLSNRRK